MMETNSVLILDIKLRSTSSQLLYLAQDVATPVVEGTMTLTLSDMSGSNLKSMNLTCSGLSTHVCSCMLSFCKVWSRILRKHTRAPRLSKTGLNRTFNPPLDNSRVSPTYFYL